MPGLFVPLRFWPLAALLFVPLSVSLAASNDDTVEWDGVFSDPSFRRPIHPVAGQSFTVDLRVFRGDLTAVRLRTYDGIVRRHEMSWVRNDGSASQYDLWRATVPGSEAPFLFYRFELVDGADTDYYNRLGMSGSEPSSGDFLLNLTGLGAYPLGATPEAGSTVFRLWAPGAASVHVVGDFNGWNPSAHPLTPVAGIWQTRVAPAFAGQEYKYLLDHEGPLWRTDPHARRHTSSVGNSVIWDPADFAWTDTNWVTPLFEDMILYELHVGTFSGEGDGATGHPGRFRDVVDRHLDHLVESGVNVVELMPVNEFAADISWGYNPVSQYAIETAYGSPDDLKYLVNRLHQAGIAVIIDVVFNHMGASDLAGNLLDFDGTELYFYPSGSEFRQTPWGPRPDYGIREVREYLVQAIRHWLDEYHMDGFRLDGTAFIKVNTDGWRLLRDVAFVTDTRSRKAIVTAEQLPNDPAVTRPADEGGAGLDSQWNDAFHDGLRDALNAAAFGDPDLQRLAQGMNHLAMEGRRAVNYIESHDEAAVHGRVVEVADPADPHGPWAYRRGKLAYGLVMFTAGIPMILQGQELMEDRRFGDTVDHRIRWEFKQRFADYFLACRDMTWLRRRSPALRADAGQNLYHLNESANVLAWHRWAGPGDDLVIVVNLGNADFERYCLGMPLPGDWLELLNTEALVYGGGGLGNGEGVEANGGSLHGLPHSACITLPRASLLVLGRRTVDLEPDLDADNDGIPNAWERIHNLDPNRPEDGGLDPDFDGMSNREEYQAGTDPRSAASRLLIRRFAPNPAGQPTLLWKSAEERRYVIHASPTLDPPLWILIGTRQGTGLDLFFTDTREDLGQPQFYRIQAFP